MSRKVWKELKKTQSNGRENKKKEIVNDYADSKWRETEGKIRTVIAEGKNNLRRGTQREKEMEERRDKCR